MSTERCGEEKMAQASSEMLRELQKSLEESDERLMEIKIARVNGNDMMNISPCPSSNLTPMPLPFYDLINTMLDPHELPSSFKKGFKTKAQAKLSFKLSSNQLKRLSTSETEFPRTEVQLRFFNVSGNIANKELHDELPFNCVININDEILPSMEEASRPLNITPYVIDYSAKKTHQMIINWTADIRKWAVAVYLVTCLNSDIVCERVLKSPAFEWPPETTEDIIRKRLNGDNADIAMDSLKISLLCPLGKSRMRIAARFRDCSHIQCFDLEMYLQMNENRPTWKCCVCNESASFNKIVIDKYFTDILNDLNESVTDVELLRDGSYREINENDTASTRKSSRRSTGQEKIDVITFDLKYELREMRKELEESDERLMMIRAARMNKKNMRSGVLFCSSAPIEKKIDIVTLGYEGQVTSEETTVVRRETKWVTEIELEPDGNFRVINEFIEGSQNKEIQVVTIDDSHESWHLSDSDSSTVSSSASSAVEDFHSDETASEVVDQRRKKRYRDEDNLQVPIPCKYSKTESGC